MPLLTIEELFQLTPEELRDLMARLTFALLDLKAGTGARSDVLRSLATLRRVLLLRNIHL